MALPASHITAAAALLLLGAKEEDINNELDVIYQAIALLAEENTNYLHDLVDKSASVKVAVMNQLTTDGYVLTVQPDGKVYIDWSGE